MRDATFAPQHMQRAAIFCAASARSCSRSIDALARQSSQIECTASGSAKQRSYSASARGSKMSRRGDPNPPDLLVQIEDRVSTDQPLGKRRGLGSGRTSGSTSSRIPWRRRVPTHACCKPRDPVPKDVRLGKPVQPEQWRPVVALAEIDRNSVDQAALRGEAPVEQIRRRGAGAAAIRFLPAP